VVGYRMAKSSRRRMNLDTTAAMCSVESVARRISTSPSPMSSPSHSETRRVAAYTALAGPSPCLQPGLSRPETNALSADAAWCAGLALSAGPLQELGKRLEKTAKV
jgi:hypothetical protein